MPSFFRRRAWSGGKGWIVELGSVLHVAYLHTFESALAPESRLLELYLPFLELHCEIVHPWS